MKNIAQEKKKPKKSGADNIIPFPVNPKSNFDKQEVLKELSLDEHDMEASVLTIEEIMGVKLGKNVLAVEVTGCSTVNGISAGSVVLFDKAIKPTLKNITVVFKNNETHIQQYTKQGFVVVGCISPANVLGGVNGKT
jgi:hypothetical protein